MRDYSRCGRHFDREFKESAVALIRNGRKMREVSQDLGVSTWTLRHWRRQLDQGQSLTQSKAMDAETPEQRELRRLRQDNEYLRRQREILKKALGILSAEIPPEASK